MGQVGVESFGRLLKHEVNHEAAFVQQATVTKQVENYLKEQNQERSQAEEEAHLKRKQIKSQRLAQENAGYQRAGVNDLGISDDYDGYRLPLPVTHEGAVGLMKHYLIHGENKPLHPKYVSYL